MKAVAVVLSLLGLATMVYGGLSAYQLTIWSPASHIEVLLGLVFRIVLMLYLSGVSLFGLLVLCGAVGLLRHPRAPAPMLPYSVAALAALSLLGSVLGFMDSPRLDPDSMKAFAQLLAGLALTWLAVAVLRHNRRVRAGGRCASECVRRRGAKGRRRNGATRGTLFLLGGDIAVFELIADAFLAEAGGAEARLAILLIGGEGWEHRQREYADPWRRRGVNDIQFAAPGDDGVLDTAWAAARVREATGIVVGGGDTRQYLRLYATDPMRTAIREQVGSGVPYVGLSAGALLAPETCVLRPHDGETQPRFVPSLGLLQGLAVGVHYNREGAPDLLRQTMVHTGLRSGIGIDEEACAIIAEGEVAQVVGHAVHRVALDEAGRLVAGGDPRPL